MPKLLGDLEKQSFNNFEVITIKGDPRQGRAINKGADIANGEILIILDDDVRLGHKEVIKNLVTAVRSDRTIGMAGVSNLVPEDAPWLVRKIMKEVPRRSSPLVNEITDSDMAEHPCCAIPKKVFIEIGGENEIIPRGLDPYLRREIRNAGYRVVVIPDTWIHHLPPASLKGIIKQFFRNGVHSAYCTRFYPQWVIELADKHGDEIEDGVSIGYRSFRYMIRLIKAFFAFKWVYLLTLLCYLFGFGWGYISIKKVEEI